jgi:hypothetical protein
VIALKGRRDYGPRRRGLLASRSVGVATATPSHAAGAPPAGRCAVSWLPATCIPFAASRPGHPRRPGNQCGTLRARHSQKAASERKRLVSYRAPSVRARRALTATSQQRAERATRRVTGELGSWTSQAELSGTAARPLGLLTGRSAGVGRRARSRVKAGVVWCAGCRPLIGHFIGRVLWDTRHRIRRERHPYAARCPQGVPLKARDCQCRIPLSITNTNVAIARSTPSVGVPEAGARALEVQSSGGAGTAGGRRPAA